MSKISTFGNSETPKIILFRIALVSMYAVKRNQLKENTPKLKIILKWTKIWMTTESENW